VRDKANAQGTRAIRAGAEATDRARNLASLVNGWGGHLTPAQHAEMLAQLAALTGHVARAVRSEAGYLGTHRPVAEGLHQVAAAIDEAQRDLQRLRDDLTS
jgi:hypothetical protein